MPKKHPFVFLKRGKDAAENVAIVREALAAAGIDPDSLRAQVMVRTNETRLAMSRAWYEASPIGKKNLANFRTPYAEHEFSVGERIMFLRNLNNEYTPRGSKFKVCKVMNGMSGKIAEIFDEDTENPDAPPSQVADTRARKHPRFRRWMHVEPGNVNVLLDSYGKNRIARIPPVTIDKMQGLEADYSVVVLVKVSLQFCKI